MMKRGGYRKNAGRKKGFSAIEAEKARELIVQKLATEFGPIVDKAIIQAKAGDKSAREWLTERAYGRVITPVDMDLTEKVSHVFSKEQMFKIAERVVARGNEETSASD